MKKPPSGGFYFLVETLDYISSLSAIRGFRDALTSCQRALPDQLMKKPPSGGFCFLYRIGLHPKNRARIKPSITHERCASFVTLMVQT